MLVRFLVIWVQHHAADTYKMLTDTNEDLLKTMHTLG